MTKETKPRTMSYLRVSTNEQDNQKFKHDVRAFANSKDFGRVQFIEEKITGKKSWKTRKIATMIEGMAENAIVFALANPTPEITPEEARKGGARIVATGRSDYPNQVNNSLGFPAIFRGMLDVRATVINVKMMLAAAEAIATCAAEKGLTPDYIIPSMDEAHLYPREAVAVAEAAMASGVARVTVDVD